MTRFRFRLDRVLKLREGLERARAADLGQALDAEERRRAELAQAEQRLEDAGGETGARTTAAGSLHVRSDAIRLAAEQVREAEERARAAASDTDRERARFHGARRDRETLERLRERLKETWKIENARNEQKDLDESARRRIPPAGGEEGR